MRALRKFIGLAFSPWLKTIRTAFDLFGNPRQLSRVISPNDETSFLRSLAFLTTAYAIALATIAVTLFMSKFYFGQFGVEREINYSDLAASINSLAVFIIFGFVNFIVFRVFGEKAITLQAVWHHYSYIVGSGLIVLMTLTLGLIAIYWATIWIMIRLLEIQDLETYRFVDLTYSFSAIAIMSFVVLYSIGIYASYLNRSMGTSKVKVFLCVLVSYIASLTILIVAVLAFDRVTASAITRRAGCPGLKS